MAKSDNLVDFLKDIADAIREKTEDSGLINAQNFADKIRNLSTGSTGSGWTGHADVEGLKAIGWTDEDIAYYQEHGVNWNEEDDEYHKVSEDNKALYGVLTASNISTYKNRIIYLPKIDTAGRTSFSSFLNGCVSLVAIPKIDTSSATAMNMMFSSCRALYSVPKLDTSKATNLSMMFNSCASITHVPAFETSSVLNFSSMFNGCSALVDVPSFDMSSAISVSSMFNGCKALVSLPPMNFTKVSEYSSAFAGCSSLVSISSLDMSGIGNSSSFIANCSNLMFPNFINCRIGIDFSATSVLSKESLLCIINNEAATSAITLKLASYAYTRLANDPDIVAALANHPNISIAQ